MALTSKIRLKPNTSYFGTYTVAAHVVKRMPTQRYQCWELFTITVSLALSSTLVVLYVFYNEGPVYAMVIPDFNRFPMGHNVSHSSVLEQNRFTFLT